MSGKMGLRLSNLVELDGVFLVVHIATCIAWNIWVEIYYRFQGIFSSIWIL